MEHTKTVVGKDGRDYVLFSNGWSPLSAYYPCKFTVYDVTYRSVQQMYQALKAKHFGDLTAYRMIMKSWSANVQAEIGSTVENFNPDQWQKKSVQVMERATRLKFAQNDSERQFLLDTGNAVIVFVSQSQSYWGNGLTMDHEGNTDQSQWTGNNKLGEILMKLRDEIKAAL